MFTIAIHLSIKSLRLLVFRFKGLALNYNLTCSNRVWSSGHEVNHARTRDMILSREGKWLSASSIPDGSALSNPLSQSLLSGSFAVKKKVLTWTLERRRMRGNQAGAECVRLALG
jgi:hypothetical protein